MVISYDFTTNRRFVSCSGCNIISHICDRISLGSVDEIPRPASFMVGNGYCVSGKGFVILVEEEEVE